MGILEAIRSGASYVGFLDADLATPLCELDRFRHTLERVPEIEMVLGSRMHLLEHQMQRPLHRRLLADLFRLITKAIFRIPFRDTQCGAKMFRVTNRIQSLFRLPFEHLGV